MANRPERDTRVAVIGLGRFGGSLANALAGHGWEVLAIDTSARIVQEYSGELTHAAVADSTDSEALRQLGVPDFRRVVVGIGTNLEASILTTSVLVDLAVPAIWAKAVSHQHARILERIGAHHVVLPEHQMGERVAHLVTGRMLDFIEFEDNFALVKTLPPREALNRPVGEAQLRRKYGVTVLCIKRHGEDFTYVTADTVINPGDILIVGGQTRLVERFADLT